MYLLKPEQKYLSAFKRLKGNEDFKMFQEWMEKALQESDKNNRQYIEDHRLRNGQGISNCLQTVLDYTKQ